LRLPYAASSSFSFLALSDIELAANPIILSDRSVTNIDGEQGKKVAPINLTLWGRGYKRRIVINGGKRTKFVLNSVLGEARKGRVIRVLEERAGKFKGGILANPALRGSYHKVMG
jgi:hypothetical protein